MGCEGIGPFGIHSTSLLPTVLQTAVENTTQVEDARFELALFCLQNRREQPNFPNPRQAGPERFERSL